METSGKYPRGGETNAITRDRTSILDDTIKQLSVANDRVQTARAIVTSVADSAFGSTPRPAEAKGLGGDAPPQARAIQVRRLLDALHSEIQQLENEISRLGEL